MNSNKRNPDGFISFQTREKTNVQRLTEIFRFESTIVTPHCRAPVCATTTLYWQSTMSPLELSNVPTLYFACLRRLLAIFACLSSVLVQKTANPSRLHLWRQRLSSRATSYASITHSARNDHVRSSHFRLCLRSTSKVMPSTMQRVLPKALHHRRHDKRLRQSKWHRSKSANVLI